MTEYLYVETTKKIIGACMNVHNTLGPGFEEVIYQRALAQELIHSSIGFAREQWLTIKYNNIKVGTKRVDFIVEDVLVELKAKSEFFPQDFVQTLSYLKASGYKVGLLVNFGAQRLEFKRLVN